ncbi:MAG TPA: HAD-IIIA family hydrolase [Solirubrobacteraceae bacterium]|jgi:D-glycero-D-manno-heptose 1,7-bisphosphate phosphatase
MSVAHGRAAAFLDRDGVLNELVPDRASGEPESPLSVDDVRLIPGAAAAAAALARLGLLLVCVSNQPAAAKGRVSVARLLAVHDRVIELLREQGVELAASRLCLHHEHGAAPELTGPCDCRKPAPGMLLDGARSLGIDLGASWMVGDTDADIAAGKAAGCMTLLIRHPGSVHKRLQAIDPDLTADTFTDGAAEILTRMSETIGLS